MTMKVTKKTLLYGVIALIFLEPPIFEQAVYLSWLDSIFNIGRIIGALIIFFEYLITFKKFSLYVIIVFLMELPMFVAAITNNTDYRTGLVTMVTILSVCMLSECMIRRNNFFTILVPISIFYMVINILSILVFKNGMAQSSYYYNNLYWFLGYKNEITRWCVLFCSIILLKNTYKGNMLKNSKLFFVLCFAQIILSGSSTGFIVMLIMLVGILIINKTNAYIFNIDIGYAVYAVVCFILIFISLEGTIIDYIFKFVFHKSFTLSDRTVIWKHSIELLKNTWLTGNGYATDGGFFEMGSVKWGVHNAILGILTAGGVISVVFFIILLLYMRNNIRTCYDIKVKNLLSLLVFVYLFCGLTEEVQNTYSMYFIFSFVISHNKFVIKQIYSFKHNFKSKLSR